MKFWILIIVVPIVEFLSLTGFLFTSAYVVVPTSHTSKLLRQKITSRAWTKTTLILSGTVQNDEKSSESDDDFLLTETESESSSSIPSPAENLAIEEKLLSDHDELESFLKDVQSESAQSQTSFSIPGSPEENERTTTKKDPETTNLKNEVEPEIPFFLHSKEDDLGPIIPFFLRPMDNNTSVKTASKSSTESIPFFLRSKDAKSSVHTTSESFVSVKDDSPVDSDPVEGRGKFPAPVQLDEITVDQGETETKTLPNVVDNISKVQQDDLDFQQLLIPATLGKIPFVAFLWAMHFKETFGDRGHHLATNNETDNSMNASNLQRIETIRMHFARADNEFHHLQILEDLSSGREATKWIARLLSLLYFWSMVGIFCLDEKKAYRAQKIVSDRFLGSAYANFLESHETKLRNTPVPESAKNYYEIGYRKDPYLFDMIAARDGSLPDAINDVDPMNDSDDIRVRRHPYPLTSLYDVVRNMRDDEEDHSRCLQRLVAQLEQQSTV